MKDDKKALYQANITRSLGEMYQHMEQMLDTIPDDINPDNLLNEHIEIIDRITAIEEEWIIDPAVRLECSLIHWEEDED